MEAPLTLKRVRELAAQIREEWKQVDEVPRHFRIWWDYEREEYRVLKEDEWPYEGGLVVEFGPHCELKRKLFRTERALLFALEQLEARTSGHRKKEAGR